MAPLWCGPPSPPGRPGRPRLAQITPHSPASAQSRSPEDRLSKAPTPVHGHTLRDGWWAREWKVGTWEPGVWLFCEAGVPRPGVGAIWLWGMLKRGWSQLGETEKIPDVTQAPALHLCRTQVPPGSQSPSPEGVTQEQVMCSQRMSTDTPSGQPSRGSQETCRGRAQ